MFHDDDKLAYDVFLLLFLSLGARFCDYCVTLLSFTRELLRVFSS